ncbi:ninja-family protein AFP3-like [Juglans microcarpa x Juglans regia]|uniref:ninja-family protein AFP3-like n=1 Tax=Juglans microcarpa x Juglans regia TaxID=2249226 RepID=UPI001B7E769B|nr:ninja-family protein AFP3-like [Juglans microcarpa x Juglans regia]XP_041002693.1 ninja-family protein AFP3-like [Juglans microcarpa x Juglans regia]
MAQAEDFGSRGPKQTPMQRCNFPRDLLQRFTSGIHSSRKLEEPSEDAEEIELSLGLSLNGRFGVDPSRANQLTRSSSIPDFLNPGRDKDAACVVPMACAPLIRTCSLPTETQEEWRKRKELQTLRRMEAKRKRSEKQRTSKATKDRSRDFCVEESGEEDKRMESSDGNYQKERYMKAFDEFSCSVALPLGVSVGRGGCGVVLNVGKGDGLDSGGSEEEPQPPSLTQGSIGSQGSGSSGISESESRPALGYAAGMNKCIEARSPNSLQSSPESGQKPPVYTGRTITEKSTQFSAVVTENESNKANDADKGAKEIVRNVLEGMPSVSTKGDGPNGKRIEGFLYRYRKGEEVRIVCVCHGSFLSPAEFVKHAGGGDVAQPLKHIVVNPTSFF